MKSFGIGLALLVGGFACYLLQPQFAPFVADWGDIGGMLTDSYVPICVGIMGFGVGWYWVVGPILQMTKPKEKD